jgi:hypothetical protein
VTHSELFIEPRFPAPEILFERLGPGYRFDFSGYVGRAPQQVKRNGFRFVFKEALEAGRPVCGEIGFCPQELRYALHYGNDKRILGEPRVLTQFSPDPMVFIRAS